MFESSFDSEFCEEYKFLDILEKPRLILPSQAIMEDLYIVLNPSVSAFETELCTLIAEDKSLWERTQIDPALIYIKERRLKVCI